MDKTKDNCPHCNKKDCFDDIAYYNAESYGSRIFKMLCRYCRKPISVSIVRSVRVDSVEIGNHKPEDSDWQLTN